MSLSLLFQNQPNTGFTGFFQGMEAGKAAAKESTLQQLAQQAMGGDKDALQRMAGIDPETAMNIQQIQANEQTFLEKQMQVEQQKQQRFGRLALDVLNSPNPEIAYRIARREAEMMGADVSQLPEQFTPDLMPSLQMYAQRVLPDEQIYGTIAGSQDAFEREINQGQLDVQRGSLGLQREELGLKRQQLAQDRELAMMEAQAKAQEEQSKKQGESRKLEASLESAVSDAIRTIQTIDNLKPQVTEATAGFGSLTRFVPGTESKNVEAALKTIGASTAFNTLQEMRKNSPTGGALGSIAVPELELLKNSIYPIDQGQSPEVLSASLTGLRGEYEKTIENAARAFYQDYGYVPESVLTALQKVKTGAVPNDIRSAAEAELARRQGAK